jgi:hypothetical protein
MTDHFLSPGTLLACKAEVLVYVAHVRLRSKSKLPESL